MSPITRHTTLAELAATVSEKLEAAGIHQVDLIDWPEIDRWVLAEGIASAPEVAALYREIRRRVP